MTKKIITILILILILFIFNISAAAELKDPWISEKEQGQHGGTLITTLLGDPKTFNTIIAKETSSSTITDGYIFEGLVTRNGVTTEYEPELAKSWDISEDGRKYTFYLREGVQWSDGKEFKADDVIFTFDVIKDENIPTSSRDVLKVNGEFPVYKKIDKYTVQFTLPESFAPFLNNMTAPIIPKHKLNEAWEKGEFNNSWGINTDPAEIVGTGPFKLVDYKNGERVVMEKNNYYWRQDPNGKTLPYINRWIRVIAESQETESLLFEKGQTHYLSVRGIDYRRIKAESENNNFSVVDAGPTFSTNFLVFNMNPRNPNLEDEPYKYEWFTNLNFRRAIAHAFDKETMINQALAGQGTKQWSPISIANKVYLNEGVKRYPYNLEKAREELEKGGFKWNENGELLDANNNKVEFTMVTNAGNNVRESLVNIIASELRELGIKVNSTPIEFNKMVNQLSSEWNFDSILIGLTGGVEPHQGTNVWMSNGHLHMWNPVQEEPATEWEKRIDELFVKGSQTVDLEKRKEYYNEFQEIVAEKLPVIYTVTPNSLYAVRDSLKNTEVTAYGGVLWNIHELYLEN
ncbi:peptide/nickel transport system substrate-binding protein [Halanaerobium congolense]|uniref:Peptide/nickel transport system substrate-binding protein n=2 Tax=Halanaerobium TaxID=2330 RepID=A0A4R8GBZ8_9FIRM|nr:ABC transporter substrate-binding protein [Halanaerobium congolense]TDX35968.1 peptide/nickel transport system substrate-binding protein [Halanaerobium congolense]